MRALKIIGIIVGAILLLIGILAAYIYYRMTHQKDTHDLQDKVSAICNKYIEEGKSPGLFVGVIQGDTVFMQGYGVMDKETGRPVDSNTVFEIGSVSKVFTAELAELLVERGELNWDDPISSYMPEEVRMENDGTTLLNLATHTSGYPRLPEMWFEKLEINECDPYSGLDVQDLYTYLNNVTDKKKPAMDGYDYSNLGAGLLGHILEWKTQQNYETLLQELILQPLGMQHTSTTNVDSVAFATGYDEQGKQTCYWQFPIIPGAGAIRSTGADMLKFLKANIGGDSRLSPAFAKTHKQVADIGGDGIAKGWHIDKLHGVLILLDNITWHNGGTGGFRSYIAFAPDRKRGVVVLANQASESDFDEMAIRIMVKAASISLR